MRRRRPEHDGLRAEWPLIAVALLALAIGAGCSDRTLNVVDESGARATDADASKPMPVTPPAGGSEAGMSMPDATIIEPVIQLCQDGPCACNDGIDNDDDGRLDGYDPECTGPFDDDESSFGTGMPGSKGKCQDCFFDDNASTTDDGCSYHRDCLDSSGAGDDRCGCDVSAECVGNCRTRTPNGCDCFGCCHIFDADGALKSVQLGEDCTQDSLDDKRRCAPCDRDETCVNPCGPCELCPGRSPDSIPATCTQGGGAVGPFSCDDGRACSIDVPCDEDFYCLQGCCIPVVF